jgi:hypothetical protein
MSLFENGHPCQFCGQPMFWQVDLIGFGFYDSQHPLIQRMEGSCHQSCLNRWTLRDEFVRAWNHEAQYYFSSRLLEVTPAGKVQYLTRWGMFQYRCGWKKSPLLPKLIEFRRPLLTLRAIRGANSPLRRTTRFGFLSSAVQPEALSLSPTLAAAVRDWGDRLETLCEEYQTVSQGRFSNPPPEVNDWWKSFDIEGHRLWKLLHQELGRRYRVVYIMGRTIFEPESEADLNAMIDYA